MKRIILTLVAVAISLLTGHTYAEQVKSDLYPLDVVKSILEHQTPSANTTYVPMTKEHIEVISPFLSKDLNKLLTEWVKEISSLKHFPEGWDPLLWRKWQPEKVTVKSHKMLTNSNAVVEVKERLASGKIYSGYTGTSNFILKIENGKWIISDIKFVRKNSFSSKDIDGILLTRNLMADITRFKQLENKK